MLPSRMNSPQNGVLAVPRAVSPVKSKALACASPQRSLDALSGGHLRRLHRSVHDAHADILRILESARAHGSVLYNGVDRRSAPRTATIHTVNAHSITLTTSNLRAEGQPQIYLHFDLDGSRYFFAAPTSNSSNHGDRLELDIPEAIYEAERRDLHRDSIAPDSPESRITISNQSAHSQTTDAQLVNVSYQGARVRLSGEHRKRIGDEVEIRFHAGRRRGETVFGRVKHRCSDPSGGAELLGIEISSVPPAALIPIQRHNSILGGGLTRRMWRTMTLASKLARSTRGRSSEKAVTRDQNKLEIVSYPNDRGQEIRGIIDRAGSGTGGTAVLIPPAWGRTKETFLPLARAITATFASIDEPVAVLRFDGTNRRGESFVDPQFRTPGDEYLGFKFSQAVNDIEASVGFLESRPDIAPKKTILVSFSLGSVEGRRAVARDRGRHIDGWVSVVGMVDLQSGLRTVSGGVDYAYGLQNGVSFGHHELVGVVADMDRTGRDAADSEMIFLEDVKRDMSRIDVPITWLHGRDDAWMDLDRVQEALSAGNQSNRKLMEVPTGHQMRSSREALETFQLVSAEVARLSIGRVVEPAIPDLGKLRLRTRAERERVPPPAIEAASFWEDYLLGRDRKFGFELMSMTTAYRDLMAQQISRIDVKSGETIVDLGAGNGDFPLLLAESGRVRDAQIIEVDLVPAALRRGDVRIQKSGNAQNIQVRRIAANLDLDGFEMPLSRDGGFDGVLASLFLSYLRRPQHVLEQIFRLLRPGGRLVISTMKRDADISRIYVDSIAELPPDRKRAHFGLESDEFDEIQRVFLNDAARLLHLEETGRFTFWDGEELAEMCESVGFRISHVDEAFGTPPQAAIVTAMRPGT